jgi:hypothetical protein
VKGRIHKRERMFAGAAATAARNGMKILRWVTKDQGLFFFDIEHLDTHPDGSYKTFTYVSQGMESFP